ncbi:hypothetical protein ACOMHN_035132 [Nucella lapillus]
MMEQIMKEQKSQRKLLENLLARQPGSDRAAAGEPSLPEGMADMPLVTVHDMDSFEKNLADIEKKNRVIRYLALIGGDTPKEIVRRVLTHVMHQELVVLYTWQGTPQKKSFMNLLLCNVLKKVVRENPSTKAATDKEIDFAVREFFRTASDRNGGRKRRIEKRASDPAEDDL